MSYTPRYIIEGTWTGYRESQRKVVHVEVTRSAGRFNQLNGKAIKFTDNTHLLLQGRQMNKGEIAPRLKPTYRDLISECVRKDVWEVAQL